MTRHVSIGHRLPQFLAARLFGDRERFGLIIQPEDSCWRKWQTTYMDFYGYTQTQSVSSRINEAG